MPHASASFILFILFLIVISVWIVLLPSPGICTHILNPIFCFPAKLSLRLACIRIAGSNITGTAGLDHIRDLNAGSLFKILHYIQNTVAYTSSQVVDLKSCFLFDLLQRFYMSFCQIYYMDIVTDSVPSGVS